MKRLFLTFALLLVAIPAFAAAPTLSQHASNFSNATTTVSATFPSAPANGDVVIACGGVGGSGVTMNTPTMTGGTFTSWTSIANGANGTAQCWLTGTVSGAGTSVALTSSGAADIHLHVFDVSGQAASPKDNQGAANSSANPATVTSGATTTANDLIIPFFFDNANNQTLTAGAGYSSVDQSNNTTGGDVGLSEQKTVAATGTQTATAGGNALADTLQCIVLAVAGTAGGGGGTTPPPQMMSLGVGALAYSINEPNLLGFQGCLSNDPTCTMEADLCDEKANCLHFPVGSHTLALNFLKAGVPTQVATSTFQVTVQ
jgi:hypothetical protein